MIYTEAVYQAHDMRWRCVRDDFRVDFVCERTSPLDQRTALRELIEWRNRRPEGIWEQLWVLAGRTLAGDNTLDGEG